MVEKKTKKPTQEEYEKEIQKLAKEGLTAEKIGERLRQRGMHPKEFKKKISQILREKGIYIDPDIKNVQDKLTRITKHFEKNKQDKRAMRERDRIFSHLRKLKIYNKIE